ncbi:flagellar biosynthetic protein FliO [Shewanella japonica]|uniref:flagellar biosynthetic protein FliO n=1 Tax=Shewanella japonica TaxID=93973 RepID=UPI002495A352|nr:flagellar biosynthetic protein FliO [Shewanella japonica]
MLNAVSLFAIAISAVNEAASPVVATRGAETSNIAALSSMMGGLILVIAIIFVLAYIVKKLNLVQSNQGVIKTVAMTPLGQKEKLVLVELEGQQYLLGVTAQQVNLIEKLDSAVQVETTSFASRLKQAKEQAKSAS